VSDDRGFERAVDDWLADGSDRAPKPAVNAVLLAVRTTSQDRVLRTPLRNLIITSPLPLVAAIAITLTLGAATLSTVGRGPVTVGGPVATETAAPAPTSSPTLEPLDTATWRTTVANAFGFSISYPREWEIEASPDVAPPSEAPWPNPVAEVFATAAAPDGQGVRVSAWSVPVDPGTTIETWLRRYCVERACGTIPSEGVVLTLDGRPGVLFTVGGYPHATVLVDDRIYVVACWRANDDGAVAEYGGSRRLVEAFISTMELLPGRSVPFASSPSP